MITILKLALVFVTGTSAFVATERPSTFFHKESNSNLKVIALDEIVTTSIFGAAVYFTVTKADEYDEDFKKEVTSWKDNDAVTQNPVEIEMIDEIVEEKNMRDDDISETPETEDIVENIEESSKDTKISISSTIDFSLKKSVASTLTGEKQKQARLKASQEKELVTAENISSDVEEQEKPVPESAESTEEEAISSPSFGKKAIVKVLMPWKKFSSIK